MEHVQIGTTTVRSQAVEHRVRGLDQRIGALQHAIEVTSERLRLLQEERRLLLDAVVSMRDAGPPGGGDDTACRGTG